MVNTCKSRGKEFNFSFSHLAMKVFLKYIQCKHFRNQQKVENILTSKCLFSSYNVNRTILFFYFDLQFLTIKT